MQFQFDMIGNDINTWKKKNKLSGDETIKD